ncbi:MAG: hypothetical protein KA214_10265 [Neisseriaceae bacterium]|nr:hypothetical protein [Neisseriaceae bacterium]
MKKFLLLASSLLVLAACGDKDAGKPADTASNMPAECQEYMTQLQKLAESSPAADQFKEMLKTSEAQWANVTAEQSAEAATACKQASEMLKSIPGQ